MYSPRSISWLVGLIAILGIGLFLAIGFRLRFRIPERILLALFVLVVTLVAAVGWIRRVDGIQLQKEFVGIQADEINWVELERGTQKLKLNDRPHIQEFFSSLQGLKATGSHHSSPRNIVRLRFPYRGQNYDYGVGQDSEIATEFWVLEYARHPGSHREIGRFNSAGFERLLSDIMSTR